MYTKKIQITSGIFHGIRREKGLQNYFIPCHRKYGGKHNVALNRKVRFNTVESIAALISCILIGCIFYGMV